MLTEKNIISKWKDYSYEDDTYSIYGRWDHRAIKFSLPFHNELAFIRYIDKELSKDQLCEMSVFYNGSEITSYNLKHASDKEASKAVLSFLAEIENNLKTIKTELKDNETD